MIPSIRFSPLLLIPLAAVLLAQAPPRIDPAGATVETRFAPPAGFAREPAAAGSFAAFLRRLPLKAHGEPVRLYDGRIKANAGVYAAVVDLRIGRRDLHQCADAVMRLRAEHLFAQRRFDEIRFRFVSGFVAEYSRWRRGERIAVSGNAARWVPGGERGDGRRSFWRYLETVFAYAGTASLALELAPAAGNDPAGGDVFIRPGRPGHAVIVVDRCVDAAGRALFLLAQSYMPAQEIQVLLNPGDAGLSPWYPAAFGATLVTPEWTFKAAERMRFPGQ
jgi:hypothetical protein